MFFFISIFVLGFFFSYTISIFLFFMLRREMFISYVLIPYCSSRFEPFKSPLSLDPNVPFRVFYFKIQYRIRSRKPHFWIPNGLRVTGKKTPVVTGSRLVEMKKDT